MSRITFGNTQKGEISNTVNKLLDSVLPGHSTSNKTSNKSSSRSLNSNAASQIINDSSSKKNLDSNEVRRLKRKEKLAQRKLIRKSTQELQELNDKARYELLISHKAEDKLTSDEKKELKRLIARNIAGLETWKTEIDDDLEEIQGEILDLKKEGAYFKQRKRKAGKNKLTAADLYSKKKSGESKRYPGLTPGLAPVDMEDSDSD